MIQAIGFTAYSVTDMARARQFYESVLGLKPSAETFSDHWQEYDLGDATFGIGAANEDAPEYFRRKGASVAFEVTDLDALFARLKDQGVTILQEPMAFPNCRMFVIADPDNNAIFLHQLGKK